MRMKEEAEGVDKMEVKVAEGLERRRKKRKERGRMRRKSEREKKLRTVSELEDSGIENQETR